MHPKAARLIAWTTAVFLPCLILVPRAIAGTSIEQIVTVQNGKHTTKHKYQWSLDGKRFALSISGSDTQSRYIFNGRVLYICGKLPRKRLGEIPTQALKDKDLLKALQQGACQAVPSNFMARFFLAPVAAAGSIEPSDGLRLSIDIDNYTLKEAQGRRIKGHPCQTFERQMRLSKNFDDGRKTALQFDETFCVAKAPPWRGGFWPEVAKQVLRQPQGVIMMRRLKADHDKLKGPMLAYRAEVKQDGSPEPAIKLESRTTDFKVENLSPALFKLPVGYVLFDHDKLETTVAAPAADGQQKPATNSEAEPIKDKILSAFFCAIAGALACFAP